MRLAQCGRLSLHPLTGVWFRALRPQFFARALQFSHTSTISSRFNDGQGRFPLLYLAEDQMVALFEVSALLGSPLPGQTYVANPFSAWTVINADVRLHRIAHLTRASQRKIIRATVQELTGDWRGYALRARNPASIPGVPTQRLGAALHGVAGLEGFITYSAKVPTRRNLVIFPDQLDPRSRIRFFDPATGQRATIPSPS